MDMRFAFQLLLPLSIMTIASHAQNEQTPALNIGDTAPPLRLRGWIKGEPFQQFQKDKIYVVEFWASWCKPCKAAMPHLSALARQYRNDVVFLGVDVYEDKTMSMARLKAFADSMGNNLDYFAAAEDSNFMATDWLNAAAQQAMGIPRTFIINKEGRLAWIGHPAELDKVLLKVVDNKWSIDEALLKHNIENHLRQLDDSLDYELMNFWGDFYKGDYMGKPDSALLLIDGIVKKEPRLKYTPRIAYHTFTSLLKTNQHKALEYGNTLVTTSFTFRDPGYDIVIGAIESNADKLSIDAGIYRLGAQACQMQIDQFAYPELISLSKYYYKMALWFWMAYENPGL